MKNQIFKIYWTISEGSEAKKVSIIYILIALSGISYKIFFSSENNKIFKILEIAILFISKQTYFFNFGEYFKFQILKNDFFAVNVIELAY